MKKGGAVYIMTNQNNTTLYVGVTENLLKRIVEHKTRINPSSFTSRYKIKKLVYFELFHSIEEAICREKQLKSGSRKKKNDLINAFNPSWKDLYEEVKNW
ncbi:GIY-YIG nuclease family protein [Cyclobacterium salsum]|uniref:GIY-YIG nuclease family protein n=1 Tax=Cyclobacterium salsum TaxID=2666329 RepID=UPI001390D4E3|nr:GIY-YIG nuclease family protein [Cyclobacterium salsum]